MALNTLGFEQASALLTALYSQVTGSADASTPVDTSSFISMAQATLRSGYEPVMSAISQVLGRTLIAVRPYSRKFKGLEMTADRWGGITRKINFIDTKDERSEMCARLTFGLFALLNSTIYDRYLSIVSKSKQINATEFADLPLPSAAALRTLGGNLALSRTFSEKACDKLLLNQMKSGKL